MLDDNGLRLNDILYSMKHFTEIIYLIQQTSDGLKWTKSPSSLEYDGALESAQVDLDIHVVLV